MPHLPIDVRNVEGGFLFSLSWASRALALFVLTPGCGCLAVSVVPGALGLGWRLVFFVVGALVTSVGLRLVRSKVFANAEGLRCRTAFGWRELPWSTVVGLQVGSFWWNVRVYPIWIVRVHRRALLPLALASVRRDDANAKVELLLALSPRRLRVLSEQTGVDIDPH